MDARHAMNELNEMDEKLQRLGLSENGGADPLKGYTAEASKMYVQTIHMEKEDRRKMKQEKEYRAHIANTQQAENERFLAKVGSNKSRQAIIESASALLREETQKAGALVQQRESKAVEQRYRASQMAKDHLPREAIRSRTSAGTSVEVSDRSGEGSVRNTASSGETNQSNAQFCRSLAEGLVNLTFLVSDNRFLLADDVYGKPVSREREDLSVTQWRSWVRACLYPSDACDAPRAIAEQHYDAAPASDPTKDEAPCEDSLESFAKEQLRNLADLQSSKEKSVRAAVARETRNLLKNTINIQHKEFLEGIRREANESGFLLEEIFPRWSQHIPPAGRFVQGDELSGAPLLAGIVERLFQSGGMQASTPPTPKSASSGYEDRFGVYIRSPNIVNIFVTPRTLGTSPAAPQRAASANRSRKGGARASVSGMEDDEKKEVEVLAETICKDIVFAHFHNLHVLTEGLVPPPPLPVDGTAAKSKMAAAEEKDMNNCHHLYCFNYVGFPESTTFYQQLHTKLTAAVQAVENDMALTLEKRAAGESIDPSLNNSPAPKGKAGAATKAKPNVNAARGKKNAAKEGGDAGTPSEQRNNYAFPPVCLIGCFLDYDVLSRERRLRQSHWQNGTSGLRHQVFNPEPQVLLAATTSKEKEKESSISNGNACQRAPAEDMPKVSDTWSCARVRQYLSDQQAKTKSWKRQWCECVSRDCLLSFQDVREISTAQKDKPRKRSAERRKSHDQHLTSAGSFIKKGAMPAAAPKSYTFPKVLFFTQKEDVSDERLSDFLKNLTADSSSVQENNFYVLSEASDETDTRRWSLLNYFTYNICSLSELSTRLAPKELLVPDQIPPALRLSDSRLPSPVLDNLIQTYKQYESMLQALGYAPKDEPGYMYQEESFTDLPCDTDAVSNCLSAEMELLRAAYLLPENILKELREVHFGTDVQDGAKSATAFMRKTQQHASMDKNLEAYTQKLTSLSETFSGQLVTRSSLLLYNIIQNALTATADVMYSVSVALLSVINLNTRRLSDRHNSMCSANEADLPSSVLSKNVSDRAAALRTNFLANVHRPEMSQLEEMVRLLSQDRVSDFWTRLDNYATSVQACLESMLKKLISTAEEERNKVTAVAAVAASEQENPPSAGIPPALSVTETAATMTAVISMTSSVPALAHLILSHTLSAVGGCNAETDLLHTPRGALCSASGERTESSHVVATGTNGDVADASPWIKRCVALLRGIFTLSKDCKKSGVLWLNTMYDGAMSTSVAMPALPDSVSGLFSEQGNEASSSSSLEKAQWCALLESFALHGKPILTEDDFVLSHLLLQLHVLWQYVEDGTPSLLSDVHNTMTCEPLSNLTDLVASTLWYERHLLQYPCRSTQVPFLVASEYRALFSNACNNEGRTEEIDIRQWCVALLLRRNCMCNNIGCRRKHSIHEPTVTQLQQMVVSIPVAVKEQKIASDERIDLVPLRCPFEHWARATWWGDVAANKHAPDMLLLALTACFRLTKQGVMRKKEPSLARLLCTLALRDSSQVESMEFLFHAVAALCYSREMTANDTGRAYTVPPTEAEKISVSPELFYFFFSLLCKTHFEDDELPLFDDIKLLQQIEHIDEITLSDLLSSHWGILLVNNFFLFTVTCK